MTRAKRTVVMMTRAAFTSAMAIWPAAAPGALLLAKNGTMRTIGTTHRS